MATAPAGVKKALLGSKRIVILPGQYFDAETGLNYNLNRDYNPQVGQYIESDPVGIMVGENHLYGYVQNNPINRFDPLGLNSCNGSWMQRSYVRANVFCICYWLCVPCDGPVVWGGNDATLPSTRGTMTNSKGGAGAKSGDFCLCNKPGPEKNCCK